MRRKPQLGAEPRREEKTTNEKGSYNFHSPLRRDYPGSWTGITTTYKVFLVFAKGTKRAVFELPHPDISRDITFIFLYPV
jgi:hypothetical protein